METANEIGTSASRLLWGPSPTLHVVLSVFVLEQHRRKVTGREDESSLLL